MAVLRDFPYGQFNFLVDLGTGSTDGPQAGFQECSEIGMAVDVIEYRNGNDRANEVRKLTGLARYPDVTLRRGIIGSLDLNEWIDQVRNGDQGAVRTVTDPAPERGSLRDRDDVEVAPSPDRQARQRAARRAAHGCRHGGVDARLRAARAELILQ